MPSHASHLFPDLHTFWFLEKNALCEICVSGTLLMIQLTLIPPLMSIEVTILVSENSARGNCVVLGLGMDISIETSMD